MKYDYTVKHDGIIYLAGQEVPVEKAKVEKAVAKAEKPIKKTTKKEKE